MQRISFPGTEFGFGQSDSAPHAGTRSVGVELLEYIQEQDGGTTETVSEAPGAYGSGCGHTAGAAPYETASTLAPWRGRGRAARCVSKSLQPAAKPSPLGQTFHFFGQECPWKQVSRHAVVYTDASAKGWGATFNGLAVSGGLDGSPTALAYQLPRVAGSTPGLEPSQETLTRRARTGPYGQHCDRCVHQPTRWSTLPSHVVTRPPPPPLESEASEVASRYSYSGLLNGTADELS